MKNTEFFVQGFNGKFILGATLIDEFSETQRIDASMLCLKKIEELAVDIDNFDGSAEIV